MIAAYKGVTGKDAPPIYAFKLKQEDVPKKKKEWTEFNTWFHQAMTDYLEKNSMSQEFVDCNASKRHLSDNDTLDFHYLLRKKSKEQ